jgi:hypothetical protein
MRTRIVAALFVLAFGLSIAPVSAIPTVPSPGPVSLNETAQVDLASLVVPDARDLLLSDPATLPVLPASAICAEPQATKPVQLAGKFCYGFWYHNEWYGICYEF